MSLKKKYVLSLVLFFLLLASIYIYFDSITNKVVVFEETYYLLNKNTSQKQIISELRTKNIDISYINWKLASLSHKKTFIPKAGEYLIPKNLTLFQIQQIFQKGKTLTHSLKSPFFIFPFSQLSNMKQENKVKFGLKYF